MPGPRWCFRSLFGFLRFRCIVDLDALLFGTHLHLFLMLSHEFRASFRVRFGQSQLLTVLIAFFNTHELATVDSVRAEFRFVRGVCSILIADTVTILRRVCDSVAVAQAITIKVLLTTLDLGTILRLGPALAVTALCGG